MKRPHPIRQTDRKTDRKPAEPNVPEAASCLHRDRGSPGPAAVPGGRVTGGPRDASQCFSRMTSSAVRSEGRDSRCLQGQHPEQSRLCRGPAPRTPGPRLLGPLLLENRGLAYRGRAGIIGWVWGQRVWETHFSLH